jgi:hypothetical protein
VASLDCVVMLNTMYHIPPEGFFAQVERMLTPLGGVPGMCMAVAVQMIC